MLMGVWWWASGYLSFVCGFPTGRLICLGLMFLEAFIAWGVYPTNICWGHCLGMGVLGLWIFLFPCRVGVGFLVGGGFMRGWYLQAFFCAYSLA